MTPDPEVTAYIARRFEVEKRQERGPFGDRIKSIDPQEFLLQRQERIDRMMAIDATRIQKCFRRRARANLIESHRNES